VNQTAPDSSPRTDVQRVLIYRLGSLGDNVVALPSYHQIARAFPNAERRLLTNIPVHAKAPAAAAVLDGSGLVHGYIDYPVGMRSLSQARTVRAAIRAFSPQVLVYLSSLRGRQAAQRDRLFFRLCGIREIIGLPPNRGPLRRPIPGTPEFEPEAERLAHSIASIGAANLQDSAYWNMGLTTAELQCAASILTELSGAPFLTVSLGTKAQANDWGEANWTALLTRMAAFFPSHRLALIGAADESQISGRAAAAWSGRAMNLCGRLAPRESAALLRSAQIFLGHDSGPMHLAAAMGVPCVAIFSARNLPRIWFPYGDGHRVLYHQTDCAGCGLVTCIEQKKKCILSITVEEVLEAVLNQLDRQLNKLK
jgi:heptosyltransferase III